MKKTNGNNRMRKYLLGGLLVGALAVGGTLAYLSTTTDPITNSFTFVSGDDISASLTEPGWEDANGLNLTPGEVVAKDPQITNTSTATGMNEYVAMRVTFQKGDNTTLSQEEYTRLMSLITIDFDDTNWVAAAAAGPVTIYNYQDTLANSETTEPLFNTVTINSSISNTDMTWLSDTLGGFKIYVEGAAIQASGYENITAAATDLDALFTSGD